MPRRQKQNQKKKKAFTIIELLVVIAVVGLLSTIVMNALGSARVAADAGRIQSDVAAIQKAFDLWVVDTGISLLPHQNDYSFSNPVCGSDEVPLSAMDLFSNVQNLSGWAGPYLRTPPRLPWGLEYTYDNDGDTWPDDGWKAGVNLKLEWCSGNRSSRVLTIASRLDKIIDQSDGSHNGRLRWSGSNSSGNIRILLAPQGANN